MPLHSANQLRHRCILGAGDAREQGRQVREDFDGEEDSEREEAEGAANEAHDVERRRVALGEARHHHERAQAEDVVDEPACWEPKSRQRGPGLTAAPQPLVGPEVAQRLAPTRQNSPEPGESVPGG